ncbi:MAG: LacI family DNA-binding transcriptional regulator [Chitinophagales bacterium]|jgi:LacI family transcriptional regulator|nr:LacI family DNA-binding transcriptional regulator [Chitinophagales bacterium]
MSNITLKKISQSLGLSISTVSRALKNHPDISEQTKKRVRELAESLEYEPNAFAIQLRTKDSRIFGLLVPTVSNHFYESCIQAIEEESRKNGYTVIILQSGDNPETELSNLRLCKQNRVSGVFACITPNTKDVQPFLKLEDAGIPVIFFDKVPDFEACNKVCTGDIEAAGIAAERIISKQKKQVLAILGNPNLSITKKRMAAFKAAFEKNIATAKLQVVHANSTKEAFDLTHDQYQQETKPDVVFCMSDEILAGTMKALQLLRVKIPKETGIISISNGVLPKLYYPEITYVETSGSKLGKTAFNRMMSRLNGSTFVQEITVESILVEGGSL